MIFHEQKLEGVYMIEPEPFADDRGLLRRNYCRREFAEHGLMQDLKQCNVSENLKRYTLRGFHYQLPPYGENKLLTCIKGAIHNIVVDLRKESGSYLQWQAFSLTEANRLGLHAPIGCANAYLTLEDNTWILYYHSEFYSPGAEGGVRYNDPHFGFEWPAAPVVISDKDARIPIVAPDDL